jgi:hypothetical protein
MKSARPGSRLRASARRAAVLAAAMLWTVGAAAAEETQDQDEAKDQMVVQILQQTLNEHGYDAGQPDGQIGPRTTSALDAYAEDRGIASDFESVIADMFQRNQGARRDIRQDFKLKAWKEEVASHIEGSDAVTIEGLYEITDHNGVDVVCGQYNAKNIHGSYVEYSRFFGVVGVSADSEDYVPVMIAADSGSDFIVDLICSFTFPAPPPSR